MIYTKDWKEEERFYKDELSYCQHFIGMYIKCSHYFHEQATVRPVIRLQWIYLEIFIIKLPKFLMEDKVCFLSKAKVAVG